VVLPALHGRELLVGHQCFLMWLGRTDTARGIGNGNFRLLISQVLRSSADSRSGNPLELGPAPAPLSTGLDHCRDRGCHRRHRVHRVIERASGQLLIQIPSARSVRGVFQGRYARTCRSAQYRWCDSPIFASSLLLLQQPSQALRQHRKSAGWATNPAGVAWATSAQLIWL